MGVVTPNAGEVIIIRTNRYFDERVRFFDEGKKGKHVARASFIELIAFPGGGAILFLCVEFLELNSPLIK